MFMHLWDGKIPIVIQNRLVFLYGCVFFRGLTSLGKILLCPNVREVCNILPARDYILPARAFSKPQIHRSRNIHTYVMYLLSIYLEKDSSKRDSIPQSSGYEPDALPIELPWLGWEIASNYLL